MKKELSLHKYYLKDIEKSLLDKGFSLMDPEECARNYGLKLATVKNIIAGVATISKGKSIKEFKELVAKYLKESWARKNTVKPKKETRKVKTEKKAGIKDTNLNIICHYAVTNLIAEENDKVTGERAYISGNPITWHDVLVLSAIVQGYKESWGDGGRVVKIERIYELMYGRKMDKHFLSDFRANLEKSIENWQSLRGKYFDADGFDYDIDKWFFINCDFETSSKHLIVLDSPLINLAEMRHSFNVIEHKYLNEKHCKAQELKTYLLYRLMQKKNGTKGIIRRDTIERVLGISISDALLNNVLKGMEQDGFHATFDNERINFNAKIQVVKHLTTMAAD